MTIAIQIPDAPASPSPYPVRRFTVDEYHRMLETGVLAEGEEIELLEGWLIPKMTRGTLHDFVLNRLFRLLPPKTPPGWMLRAQSAITTGDSEPEPDLAIVREPDTRYLSRHPSGEEIALVIEVADASLERDRDLKASLYAAARIPQYWIVNLKDRRIEVYTDPSSADGSAAYRARSDFGSDGEIPIVIGGKEVSHLTVGEILPS